MAATFIPEPYFFLHHETPLEWTTEPVEHRIKYIQRHKRPSEVPIRLKALKKVLHPELLPQAVVESGLAYAEARRACDKAWRTCDKARLAYDEAWQAYVEAWQACDKARLAYAEARQAYNEAWQAYNEAWQAYDEAWRAYDEAVQAYTEVDRAYETATGAYLEARQAYFPEIMARLRAEYPDCPIDWATGRLIFPVTPAHPPAGA
jgi:tetratricopeptide (TPR) repeat protein